MCLVDPCPRHRGNCVLSPASMAGPNHESPNPPESPGEVEAVSSPAGSTGPTPANTAGSTREGGSLKTIGRHLIAEFYQCDADVLDDVARIREAMLDAARAVGATVLGEAFHKFDPHGVSGTVVIAESHLSIHTWPENGYVAVDIYTCGGLDPRRGFDLLHQRLGAVGARVQEILRGLPEELDADATLLPRDVQILSRTTPLASFVPHGIQAPEVAA